eukprot:scaffold410_cov446-Pavlova_lutheri.AAC.3
MEVMNYNWHTQYMVGLSNDGGKHGVGIRPQSSIAAHSLAGPLPHCSGLHGRAASLLESAFVLKETTLSIPNG